jgi:hypothetical protein
MRTFLELGLGLLWLTIAGGSTILMIRDSVRRKNRTSTTSKGQDSRTQTLSPTEVGRRREAQMFPRRRYDQPHSMPLPHWYSK